MGDSGHSFERSHQRHGSRGLVADAEQLERWRVAILHGRELLDTFLQDGHGLGSDVDVGHFRHGERISSLGTLDDIEDGGYDFETGAPPGPIRLVVSGERIRMRALEWVLEPYTFVEVTRKAAGSGRYERHERGVEMLLEREVDEGDIVRVVRKQQEEAIRGRMTWARFDHGVIMGIQVKGRRIPTWDIVDIQVLEKGPGGMPVSARHAAE